MVKMLKMLKCLRRYNLLRVVHTVWSVSQHIFNVLTITRPSLLLQTNDHTRLNWYSVTVHPEDGLRWPKHVGETF
jgi:hypothetical protein